MTMRRLLLPAVLVLGLTGPSLADDTWNPFKERDQRPRNKRQDTSAPPAQPSLPTMDGVASKPSAAQPGEMDRGGAPGQAGYQPPGAGPGPGYGQPYGPPGAAGAGGPGSPVGAQPRAEPIDRQMLPPLGEKARAVERGDISPAMTSDGSGLPAEMWQGLDAKTVEGLVASLDIPPRSPAMGALWRRLWSASAMLPEPGRAHFDALRMEALYRSGLAAEAAAIAGDGAAKPPLVGALAARIGIAAGDRARGCTEARAVAKAQGEIPKQVKTEMLLLSGYCSAADGNRESAGLAAELARAEEGASPLALAALDAHAAGQPFKPQLPKRLSLMDYRFLELAKSANPLDAAERAEPALLVALSESPDVEPRLRVAAGELAARFNALDAAKLASLYRAQTFPSAEFADPLQAKGDPALRRALLFKAAEAERTPMRKTRIVRALLDDARRIDVYLPIATALADTIADFAPAQEIGWFAETAIEINIAAARYDAARKWAGFAARDRGDGVAHWLLLIDIADAKWAGRRGEGFQFVEPLALRGRLANDLMHRLVTVLDALDYQIPIPLWEAASKTPQPNTGHLPETGVLSELQEAAKKKEFARTVLVAMRALGPNSAEGAHIIALGDSIRALRRAGLEPDARRLALEAVFMAWPRTAAN